MEADEGIDLHRITVNGYGMVMEVGRSRTSRTPSLGR